MSIPESEFPLYLRAPRWQLEVAGPVARTVKTTLEAVVQLDGKDLIIGAEILGEVSAGPEWTIGKAKVSGDGVDMSNIRFATREAAERTAATNRAINRNGSNEWVAYERRAAATEWKEVGE